MSIVEDIVKQWEADAVINPLDIKGESLRTPILHSKYVSMLATWKIKQTNLKIKLNEVRQEKTRYYNGEMSLEECRAKGIDQCQGIKPVRAVLEQMLAADNDVTKVQMQMEAVDTTVYIIESILKAISARDFQISNYIKQQAFMAGEH